MMWFLYIGGAIAVLLPVAVVVSARYRERHNDVTRAIRRAPRRRIAELRSGDVVSVVGKIVPGEVMIEALFTGRNCVYYSVKVVESIDRGPEGPSEIRTLVEEAKGIDFYVEDVTGRALVRMGDARVAASKTFSRFESGGGQNRERLEEFMLKRGHSGRGLFSFPATYTYYETVLLEGQRTAVRGVAQRRETGQTIEATEREAVFVTDTVL